MADNFNLRSFLVENKLTKNTKLLKEEVTEETGENVVSEANYSDSYNTPAAKAVNAKAGQIVKTITGYKTALQTIQDAIKQIEQEVGSEATRSEKSTLEKHLMWMFRREMEMERESVDNKKPVMENLTAKERRLVEMVQDALGITPQAVAEEAPVEEEAPIAEDEMVQENPLPKYKNIDELMANIEHGTNEAAHKYKMGRMKEIADALEAKVTSLEEGENAEHIDQKAVKSMKKDIMTLRKGVDKLEKEYDKKFGEKKSKKETQTENKQTMKSTFDLKKFLTENKLTTNSRLLKEESWPDVQLSDDARQEVEGAIESWTPEDLEEDTTIMGEIITQALEEIDGYSLPEGMFNDRMDRELVRLSTRFHSGEISLDHAVEEAVTIAMNPKNYS